MTMRNQGFSALATFAVCVLVGSCLAFVTMDWGWLDLRTMEDGKSIHIMMPLPVSLAKMALNFIPDSEINVEIPAEVSARKEVALALLEEFSRCPDATFVKVSHPEACVEIRKEGKKISWDVKTEEAVVKGSMPLTPFLRALKKWDWRTMDGATIRRLISASHGTTVYVDCEEAKVHVRI